MGVDAIAIIAVPELVSRRLRGELLLGFGSVIFVLLFKTNPLRGSLFLRGVGSSLLRFSTFVFLIRVFERLSIHRLEWIVVGDAKKVV